MTEKDIKAATDAAWLRTIEAFNIGTPPEEVKLFFEAAFLEGIKFHCVQAQLDFGKGAA